MKLQIYSVNQLQPPVDERVIRYVIHDGNIDGISFDEAELSIIPEDEKEFYIDEVDLRWSDGNQVKLDDFWSYTS